MAYVSHLRCLTCEAEFPASTVMNLCPRDHQPVEIVHDLASVRATLGPQGWWRPDRRNLWRFGALLPLDYDNEADRASIVCLGEGCTPEIPIEHESFKKLGIRLAIKDEGKPHPGFGHNPTLSFKDRGMAMTVSMARLAGLSHLAVPTQGNAGDALAAYALAGGLRATIVMSPDTDVAVLGNVARLAALHPKSITLTLVPGTIVDCGRYVREVLVPQGAFSVATFQEPGWRIEGKKTLGLEMAEPRGTSGPDARWRLPDVIVYPTGGGTGVLGMAKAFRELEALGLVGSDRPRMVCVQSEATPPLVRAFEAGLDPVPAVSPGSTIATGLNVAGNVAHPHVLRVVRESGGVCIAVNDTAIRSAMREVWNAHRFALSPEGAATFAAMPELIDRRVIEPGHRVVLVNTAAAEKYLATTRDEFDGGL